MEDTALLESQDPNEPVSSTPNPYFICIPVFFSVLTAAMVLVTQQQWLILYLCSRFVTNDGSISQNLLTEYLPGLFNSYPILQINPAWEQCRGIPEIQKIASRWIMIFVLSSGIPALFTGPILGLLSDQKGRKPLLLLGMTSTLLWYLSYLSVSVLDLGIWVLPLVGFVTGLMGSYLVMLTATLSYFADTTTPNTRGRVFIVGESFFFAGFAIGPFVGGYLTRHLPRGPNDVFLIAVVAKSIIILTTFLTLPESISPRHVRSHSLVAQLKTTVKETVVVFRNATSPAFIYLLSGMMLFSAAGSGQRLCFFLYVSYVFAWDSQDEGQYLLVSCISRMCHMLFVYPLLTSLFRRMVAEGKTRFDLSLIRCGVLVAAVCSLLMAVASEGWMLYVITLIDGFSSIVMPIIQSFLSGSVPKTSQGVLFAGSSLATQFLGLIAGIVFPTIWAMSVTSVPSIFLYIVALLYSISAGLFICGLSESLLVENQEKADEYSEIEREVEE